MKVNIFSKPHFQNKHIQSGHGHKPTTSTKFSTETQLSVNRNEIYNYHNPQRTQLEKQPPKLQVRTHVATVIGAVQQLRHLTRGRGVSNLLLLIT